MGDLHRQIELFGRAAVVRDRPERRSVIDVAANFMADESIDRGFTHSLFCLTVLPRKQRPDDEVWSRENGRVRLTIQPLADENGKKLGVPYGSTARYMMLYLQTEAIRLGTPEVRLGKSMHGWLASMGLSTGGKSYSWVAAQAARIERSVVTFTHTGEDGVARWQDTIIRGSFDPRSRESERVVRLSESFYDALTRHPVPVQEGALRHLRNRCLALDIYLWLAYRLHVVSDDSLLLRWPAIQAQFGMPGQKSFHFKADFLKELEYACAVYPEARIEVEPTGLRLFASPPPSPARPKLVFVK